ncbi:MAG: ABC transporter permease [Candidatus Acidiferrales bacterium]
MNGLGRDVSYAARRLRHSPGFVAAVVLSIGLGIAANSTIFSMISRFVLKPAPVGDPPTLVGLHVTHDGEQCCNHFPYPVYTDVRDKSQSFSGVAAYDELLPASIGGHGEPERTWGQATTANYFDVAQLPMTLGRGFRSDEEREPVVVISHELWQRRFASDPQIPGKPVRLSGHPYTVVGVAPSGFRGLDFILAPQFWIPLGMVEQLAPEVPKRDSRDQHWLAVIARLKPGVSRDAADRELGVLAKNFAAAYPATDKGNGFLLDQAGGLPPRDRKSVLVFLAALLIVVLLVLGIACANVSSLLLAQAAGRQREMAIRISLGASRPQLLRQLLAESVLLSLAGGIVGTALSLWATSALSAFHVPAPVPLDVSVSVDWRVLAYTFALSIGSGLLFGWIPAWIASRPLLTTALKGETALARPGRRITLRNALVVAQIAMSLVLLCATGLFLRSLERASNIDIGFRRLDVLMLSVDPRVHGYTPQRTSQFLDALRERVAALPGVVSTAATDSTPLSGGNRSDGFEVEGRAEVSASSPTVDLFMASPGYFDTMGIPLISGRDFAAESPDGTKVGVVNQAFVDRFFPNENPLGQKVNGSGVHYEIIGVVKNIKSRTLGEDTRPVLFRSLAQSTGSDPSFLGYTLLVRTAGSIGESTLTNSVREQIHRLDPSMAVYNVETMPEHLRSAMFLPRLAGTLFGIFGMIGIVLAALGLYGLMSYSVGCRVKELCIRIALGAQHKAVQAMVVRQGMILAATAMLIGMPSAWAVAKMSESFLYGIQPHDALTFTAVPLALAFIAALACWIPARRVAKVDLQSTLRSE